MKPPVVFLNELSYAFRATSSENMRQHIGAAVTALVHARAIRDDLVLGSAVPLSTALLGDGKQTFAEIMAPLQTQLRYLMTLARASPWPYIIAESNPKLTTEVRHNGTSGIGLTWAEKECTLTVSFAYAIEWASPQISGQRFTLRQDGSENTELVEIPNISTAAHVEEWRDLLLEYGFSESNSSLIYRSDSFSLRLFLNDHPPSHVHVQTADGRRTLSKIRLENLETLDRELPIAIRKSVMELIERHQEALLKSWERCRAGKLPHVL